MNIALVQSKPRDTQCNYCKRRDLAESWDIRSTARDNLMVISICYDCLVMLHNAAGFIIEGRENDVQSS